MRRIPLATDLERAQRSLERVLAWDFDRYVSIHGAPGNMLESGAKAHIAEIAAWAKSVQ